MPPGKAFLFKLAEERNQFCLCSPNACGVASQSPDISKLGEKTIPSAESEGESSCRTEARLLPFDLNNGQTITDHS